MEEFAKILKIKLKENNLTQRELAKRIGISEVALSRYANGERMPKGPTMLKMANALRCSVEELLGESMENEQKKQSDRLKELINLIAQKNELIEKENDILRKRIEIEERITQLNETM